MLQRIRFFVADNRLFHLPRALPVRQRRRHAPTILRRAGLAALHRKLVLWGRIPRLPAIILAWFLPLFGYSGESSELGTGPPPPPADGGLEPVAACEMAAWPPAAPSAPSAWLRYGRPSLLDLGDASPQSLWVGLDPRIRLVSLFTQ